MGFEGDDFLNCAVHLRSYMNPTKIMDTILKIEKGMGRVRNKDGTYASRSIDIDILMIDDLVKNSKKLTLPHPAMHERKFVLQPLADINAQLEHPVVKKNMVKMLSELEDRDTLSRQSKWLRNPIRDYDFTKFNYVTIEGNIGAGKTSLASQIASDLNAKLILERFMDNPFLPKFYEEPQRYAFPLEMSFLADRYQQLVDDITQFDLFKDCVVADYDAYKSIIFAKITLSEEEYALYQKLFRLMHKELPDPDIYVYLYQDTDRLLQNIKKRGRKFEQTIEASYLKKIHKGYQDYIKGQHGRNVKIIDITGRDFIEKREDYLSILQEILD